MKNICSTCLGASNDALLNCGTCKKKFHGFCVSIDAALLNAIITCPNLTWRCNSCIGTEVKTTTTDENLEFILEKLQTMSVDIEELKLKSAPQKTLADFFKNNETPRTGKRTFDFDCMLEASQNKRKHMQPEVNTPALIMGIGAASTEIKTVKPLKWLYVSNLDPRTSETSVIKLISNGLKSAPNEFSCVKLLPKNVPSPSFISFKIGMSDELFPKSMDPTLWPNGIAIREFIERPKILF